MTEIVSRIPWTRQPQYPVAPDPDLLSAGLVVLAYPVGGRFFDAVTRQLTNGAYTTSTLSKAPEDKFETSRRLTGAASGVYFPNRTGADDITGAWSVLWEGSPEANSVSGVGNGIVAGSNEPSNGRGFRAGHDDANQVFNSICGGNAYNQQNGTSNSIVSSFENFAFRFGVAWDTAAFNLYARGKLDKSVAYSAAAPTADANRRTYIGSWILGVTAPASLSVVAIFNRAVPEAIYRRFYCDSWSFFAPITRRIWVPQVAAGGDTSITLSSGALALTGYAPTAVTPLSAAPSTGQLVIGGYAPSITSTLSAEPSAGALILTGYAPTALASLSASPTTGQLVFTGAAPTATVSLSAAPSAGALDLSGYSPSITVGAPTVSISPDTGQIAVTGYAPTISGWDTAITPGVGALVIAGYAPTYSGATTIISPAAGALSLAGYTPTIETTGPVDISIGVGALLLTGHIPTISNSGYLWRIVDTSQTPSWAAVGTTQSAGWQLINTH